MNKKNENLPADGEVAFRPNLEVDLGLISSRLGAVLSHHLALQGNDITRQKNDRKMRAAVTGVIKALAPHHPERLCKVLLEARNIAISRSSPKDPYDKARCTLIIGQVALAHDIRNVDMINRMGNSLVIVGTSRGLSDHAILQSLIKVLVQNSLSLPHQREFWTGALATSSACSSYLNAMISECRDRIGTPEDMDLPPSRSNSSIVAGRRLARTRIRNAKTTPKLLEDILAQYISHHVPSSPSHCSGLPPPSPQ